VPIVPLLEEAHEHDLLEQHKDKHIEEDSPLLASCLVSVDSLVGAILNDAHLFLLQEEKDIVHKLGDIGKVFPDDNKLVNVNSVSLLVVLLHSMTCAQYFSDGIHYVEFLLHSQLVAAIGKEVGPNDFSEYMK